MLLPWHVAVLERFRASNERIPQALLLHGQAGTGKRHLGHEIARYLLCETAGKGAECGSCASCGWFEQGNHPDYRLVTSEAVAVAEGIDTKDDAPADDDTGGSRTKRAPSREIKVDQIRALHAFMSVGTHRGRYRAVLIYPLEAVNEIAANALLKMLEEPPPETVFILIADHLGRLPPTIVSRCRQLFLPTPPADVAVAWLEAQGVTDAAERLALAGGAPLTALAAASDDAERSAHRDFVAFLSRPGADAAMSTAEALARKPPGPTILWLQQWLADCIALRMTGRLRYHPALASVIAGLVARARPDALFAVMQRVTMVRQTVEHPLNTRLMLEGLLLEYVDVFQSPT